MSSFLFLFILILKTDVLCFPVHLLYDGDGLQMVTFLAQDAAALLLAFLHSDANACHLAFSLMHQVYKRMCCLTVGKKVIDYQYTVSWLQVRL